MIRPLRKDGRQHGALIDESSDEYGAARCQIESFTAGADIVDRESGEVIGEAILKAPAAPTEPDSTDKPTGCCGKTKRLIKGAVGLAKAHAGIDKADDETVSERFRQCLACEHHDHGKCGKCGCWIGPKIRVKGEACPVGRW